MKTMWPKQKLCNVCQLINGRAYSKAELLASGKYPVLRVGNFFTNSHWYYSDMELDENKYCDSGDLLYAWSASFGPRVWNGGRVIFHYHIWKVVPRETLAEKKFLYYFFQWDTEKIKQDQGTGTTMMHVSKGSMDDRDIYLPPLPEQRRIVDILDEAFEGLATAKANAENHLKTPPAIFGSELNAIFTRKGDGWQDKALSEIATTFGRGKSRYRPRNASHLYGGKYPFVQTGDIRNADHIITEYSQTYSEAGLAQSKLWPKGTIWITIAANIAETAVLGFDACFPDSVIGVVANPKEADVGFIEYLLQSFKVRIQGMGKGSAQANINMGTFENEQFPFPPASQQKQIVSKLDDLREETQRLESIYQRKLEKLDALKKSLLHHAFTGQL